MMSSYPAALSRRPQLRDDDTLKAVVVATVVRPAMHDPDFFRQELLFDPLSQGSPARVR
jgi:hypothetical protein